MLATLVTIELAIWRCEDNHLVYTCKIGPAKIGKDYTWDGEKAHVGAEHHSRLW